MRTTIAPACLYFLLAICMAGTVGGQELVSREVFAGKVVLLVPDTFEPMSEEVLNAKYPNRVVSGDTEVLTSSDTRVNVAVNHTASPLSASAIVEAHRGMEQTLRTQFPTAEWKRSEVLEKNGVPYFVIDVVTPAIDTDIRNIMFGASLDGRFLLVTFNCTRETEEIWAPLGQRIIESIEVAQ